MLRYGGIAGPIALLRATGLLRGISRRGSYARDGLEAATRFASSSESWTETLERQADARYVSLLEFELFLT